MGALGTLPIFLFLFSFFFLRIVLLGFIWLGLVCMPVVNTTRLRKEALPKTIPTSSPSCHISSTSFLEFSGSDALEKGGLGFLVDWWGVNARQSCFHFFYHFPPMIYA